jgi:hypothetical protein
MREFGRLHNVGDADAGETLGAKQMSSGIDDAVTVGGGFFAAYPHRALRNIVHPAAAQPCVRAATS